jgi:uncharacterized protein with PQ loop repeat
MRVAAMMTITEIAGFVGVGLAGVAYVPQISRLRRTRCSAGISQLAFGIWLLASLLTTARAITIHAGVFIVLGGTQIVATALIMLYAIRYRDTPCPSPSALRVHRRDVDRDGHLGRRGKAGRWTARLRSASPPRARSPLPNRPTRLGAVGEHEPLPTSCGARSVPRRRREGGTPIERQRR